MQAFFDFIKQPNPRFICQSVKDPDERNVIPLKHNLNTPASELDLEDLVGMPKALIDFYAKHNGCRLYTTLDGQSSAIYLATLDDWAVLGEEFLDELEHLDPNKVPDWIDDTVAIGEVPDSGNTFLISLAEENEGSITYFDKTKSSFTPFAKDFESFLKRLASNPIKLLKDLGIQTSFGQNQTPDHYESDSKA